MKTKSKLALDGVITALVTPFKNGGIDQASFVRLLHNQLQQGVSGLVINGTTGESPTLKFSEVQRLFEIAKTEVAGHASLIVGVGSNSTRQACDLAAQVSAWQPDAILTVVPYYNRPSQTGLVQHFTQVAESSTVPVLLYNVPARTVTGLTAETILSLSGNDNIVGVKEATGKMAFLQELKSTVPAEFTLLSGDDLSCVEFCAKGGAGVISVSSHIIAAEMIDFIKRSATSTDEYAEKYGELMRLLFIESNPIPVKMALYWMGIIASPELRLPLTPLDERFHMEFKTCLKKMGKI